MATPSVLAGYPKASPVVLSSNAGAATTPEFIPPANCLLVAIGWSSANVAISGISGGWHEEQIDSGDFDAWPDFYSIALAGDRWVAVADNGYDDTVVPVWSKPA
jgi:hypothetical protein